MWGDPTRVTSGQPPVQTVINPEAQAIIQHMGYKGRLNGPVDNPASSCLSCHSTAQIPADLSQPTVPGPPPGGANPTPAVQRQYFRNIKSGTPFTPGQVALDYSLQLQNGIANRAAAGGLQTSPTLAPGGGRKTPVLNPSRGVRVKPVRR
jgi:hypothetical protein